MEFHSTTASSSSSSSRTTTNQHQSTATTTTTNLSSSDTLLTENNNNDADSISESSEQDNVSIIMPDPNETLLLRIKSSNDVQIYAHPSDRIAKVKRAVLHALQHKQQQQQQQGPNETNNNDTTPYVRLIAAGRLLAPDSAAVQDFDLKSGQVVHAVIAHKRGAQAAASTGALRSARALRGTGINAAGFAVRRTQQEVDEDEEEEESDSEVEPDNSVGDVEQGTARHRLNGRRQRLGFDRLRDTAGLRRSEVATIRAYFSRHVDRWLEQNPAAAEQAAAGEADLVRRRLLQEDAWMQSQGPASEFRLNLGTGIAGAAGLPAGLTDAQRQEMMLWRSGGGMSATVGTDRDFAWGFMLGFFVGFLMLLWVWMPTVPHKQKLGILTGISVQLALSLWQDSAGSEGMTDDLVLTGDY